MPELNNYWISNVDGKVVIPSKGEKCCLVGECYNREGFADGSKIQTSFITDLYEDEGVEYVETYSGSLYKLGNMHPDYEKLLWYYQEENLIMVSLIAQIATFE